MNKSQLKRLKKLERRAKEEHILSAIGLIFIGLVVALMVAIWAYNTATGAY
jgi:hypothetical protein